MASQRGGTSLSTTRGMKITTMMVSKMWLISLRVLWCNCLPFDIGGKRGDLNEKQRFKFVLFLK